MAPRFTIADLMGLVVLVAVNLAVLQGAPWAAADLAFANFLAALCLATLGVAYRRGRARAACAGFALFGWTYLLLRIVPYFDTNRSGYLYRPSGVLPEYVLLFHSALGLGGAILGAVGAWRFVPREPPAASAGPGGTKPAAADV